MVLDDEGGFVQVPTFTRQVVDSVGAGDAYFAVTAMAAVLEAPCELVGFMGNIAGSLASKRIGNQKTVSPESMREFIQQLYAGDVP